jgi:LDH2 family malate/lactate/ureidoglycolate dehydrogenase
MLRDENVRIPGYRRFELEARALLEGIEIEDALFTSLHELAARV